MFDGQISYFLLLLFFFWVIEAIAKARQRGRHPEQTPDETGTQQMPTTVERTEAEQPRAPLERPRNLWEEMAEIARQQSEQKRAEPGRRAPPSGTEAHGAKHEPPRRPVPAGRGPTPARPSEFPPPTPAHAHGAPSRWEQGIGREAARATAAAAEGAAADERRSERWLAGSSGEGAAAEATGAEASGPGELSRFEQADTIRRQTDPLSKRPAYQPAPPTPSTQRADAPRKPIHGRRSTPAVASAAARRAVGPGPQAIVASVGTAERTSLSVHGLRGASRAELRRLLILQEVLGAPVALREGPLAEPPTS